MFDMIRTWIVGIASAAILVSVISALSPEGPVKKIAKFAGGLIMVLVFFQPVGKTAIPDISAYTIRYQLEYEGYLQSLESENINMMKTIIEERTRTYILEKMNVFGIRGDVTVTAEVKDGYPYPAKVIYLCDESPSKPERQELEEAVEMNLAILSENQEWMVQNE